MSRGRSGCEKAAQALEIAARIFPARAGPRWGLAGLLARDGNFDQAFRELHRRRELGYLDANDLHSHPDWSSLRSDARWKALIEPGGDDDQ